MKMVKVNSHSWLIPPELYEKWDNEFHFDFDPCPYVPNKEDVIDGIDLEWGKVNWVNPPFRKDDAVNGHGPTAFVRKAIEEKKKGNDHSDYEESELSDNGISTVYERAKSMGLTLVKIDFNGNKVE